MEETIAGEEGPGAAEDPLRPEVPGDRPDALAGRDLEKDLSGPAGGQGVVIADEEQGRRGQEGDGQKQGGVKYSSSHRRRRGASPGRSKG